MRRERALATALAFLCLVTGSCAGLRGKPKSTATPLDPATAIAVSVLDEAIYLLDPASARQSQIASNLSSFQSGYASWAPDHRTLAYGDEGIYLLDVARDRRRQLVTGAELSMPAWSPSGQVIAYGDGVKLWVTPTDVIGPYRIRLPSALAAVAMHWSGRGIAFEGIRRDCASSPLCPTTDDTDVWVVQPDGTGLRQVTHLRRALAPRWSPDGTKILFIRRFAGDKRELWVVQSNGANPSRLGTAGDVVAADWSDDGSLIAMIRTGSQRKTLQVWIARDDGSGAHPLGAPLAGTSATIDW